MKNDIKIIFVDIDWTILNHSFKKHIFDKKSLNALNIAMKNGIKVYLATARPYDSVACTGLFEIFKPSGVIASNGCVAFEEDKLVYHDHFDNDLVHKILNIAKENNLSIQASSLKDRYIIGKRNAFIDDYLDEFYEVMPDIKEYNNEPLDAILLFADENQDELIKTKLPGTIMYYRFGKSLVDIRPHQAYKSDGIKAVLNYLGLSNENALAIGDDFGDISMFSCCQYSACMGNAKDEVKMHAKYVCKSIDRHGVMDALKHFEVI